MDRSSVMVPSSHTERGLAHFLLLILPAEQEWSGLPWQSFTLTSEDISNGPQFCEPINK
jgi:hypothetical protein